jgi:Zn finger protein HypA/HybF involved in hydrogenase expression
MNRYLKQVFDHLKAHYRKGQFGLSDIPEPNQELVDAARRSPSSSNAMFLGTGHDSVKSHVMVVMKSMGLRESVGLGTFELTDLARTTAIEIDRAKARTTDAQSGLSCSVCARPIQNYHYDFESILMSQPVGGQCERCGTVMCDTHYSSWADREGKKWCPKCGGKAIWVSEGPAYSSMVDQEKRSGSYNAHIRPPDGHRAVVRE